MTAAPAAKPTDAEATASLFASAEEGVGLEEAIRLRHEVVVASEGEVVCSMEPLSGPSAQREQVDQSWHLVLTAQQREEIGSGVGGSRLEEDGWTPESLDTFWLLDYLLHMATVEGVGVDDLDAFREDAGECLDFLGTSTELIFEPMDQDATRFRATSPSVNSRLGWDDSWRVAMPALTSIQQG